MGPLQAVPLGPLQVDIASAARGVVSFRFNERVTETRNRQPEVGVVVGIAVGQLDRPYRAYLLGEGPQEHDPFGDLRGSLGLAQCARGAAGARRAHPSRRRRRSIARPTVTGRWA